MSLSEKRYIGVQIADGVYATTADIDHGYVNGPLLNGGRYRAQRLPSGVYAAACHSSYELLARHGGVRVSSDLMATKKCRMSVNAGVKVVLFVPRWLTAANSVNVDYAIYGGWDNPVIWNLDQPLERTLTYSHPSSHVTWPGSISIEPTNNNQPYYGSFRSHLPAGLPAVLKLTLTGVSYDTGVLLFDIINGDHYLYPMMPIQGPDPIDGYLGGSTVTFYWDVNASPNLWDGYHGGGDVLPVMRGWRIFNLPRFEVEVGSHYNQSNPPVTDPDNFANYCLTIVNSKGDIVHYATGQMDYPTTADDIEVTFTKDENSSFSVTSDTVEFHGHDSWPNTIDATFSNMYASILYYGANAVFQPGTVTFTLTGLQDSVMNGTHVLEVLTKEIVDITSPPLVATTYGINTKDNGPALNGYLSVNLV